jgi:Tfp pilus assembly pilus retraction ATPase PilT
MPGLTLDRLLETCVRRRATDMLLLAHTPPQIRLADSWRTLQTVALTSDDLTSFCNQIFTSPPQQSLDGYAAHDYLYNDVLYNNAHPFRVMAFGHPNPTALILTPAPNAPPPSPPASPNRI